MRITEYDRMTEGLYRTACSDMHLDAAREAAEYKRIAQPCSRALR